MCTNPQIALNLGVNPETGKQRIKFKRIPIGFSLQDVFDMYGKERVLLMPCGSCFECRMKYRKEWSVRCTAEALSYGDNNLFVTLTYDDNNCPRKLVRRDFTDFCRKLWSKGFKFRFFACGEYGSKTHRPHYHAILFGFRPYDLKYEYSDLEGHAVFSSKTINDCWKRGFIQINNFSPECAAYVAGYVNKKVGDDGGFIAMSRRPGIGAAFYEENKLDLLKYDNIICNGVHSMPRYFMKSLEKDGFDLTRLREERKEKCIDSFMREYHSHSFEHLEEVFVNRRVANEGRMKNINRRGL